MVRSPISSPRDAWLLRGVLRRGGADAGPELDEAGQDNDSVKPVHAGAGPAEELCRPQPKDFDGELEAENQGEEKVDQLQHPLKRRARGFIGL